METIQQNFAAAVAGLRGRVDVVRLRLIIKTDSRDLTPERLYLGLRLREGDQPKKWIPAARELFYAKSHLDTAVKLGYGGSTFSRAVRHLETAEKMSLQTL